MHDEPLFDATASNKLDAVYKTPDVIQQRRQTLHHLALRPGERVLDVGSGPGLLVAEMAQAVGPSGHVTGIDISPSMLALAQQRCANTPISQRVAFKQADATALPFPDQTFHAGVSTQVYEYVSDITTALAELHRVLRPGGRVLILDTDWDSIVWNASDRARMAKILNAWNERFADPYLPRVLCRHLEDAGFTVQDRKVLVLLNPEYDANTYSLTNASIMADFVVGRRGVTREEAEAWLQDLRQLGTEHRYFFSLNRYLFAATKPR